MSFEKVSKQNHRSKEPTVTLGNGNNLTFSAVLLSKFDPSGSRRVTVFIDKGSRRVGFRFHPDADLQISRMNQVRCDRIFKDLDITGDGTRYVSAECDWTDDVDCYIEVPAHAQ